MFAFCATGGQNSNVWRGGYTKRSVTSSTWDPFNSRGLFNCSYLFMSKYVVDTLNGVLQVALGTLSTLEVCSFALIFMSVKIMSLHLGVSKILKVT